MRLSEDRSAEITLIMLVVAVVTLAYFISEAHSESISCEGGERIAFVKDDELSFALCKAPPGQRYKYWVEGYQKGFRLNPLQIKVALKGRVQVR